MRAALMFVACALTPAIPAFADAPPANDFFANATVITGAAASITGTKAGASAEIGEPQHGGVPGISVWYQWTAPSSGAAVFDGGGSDFDPVIAVYTGQTVANLTLVAQSNPDPVTATVLSHAVFPVVAGQTYRIAVAGQDDGFDNFTLTWRVAAGGLVRFAQPHYFAGEESGNAVIELQRVGGALPPLTVSFTAQDADDPLSATAGLDYVATAVDATFAQGQTSVTVQVPLLSDTLVEGDELVQLGLTVADPAGALALESSAVLTIRDDDDDPANDTFAGAEALPDAPNTVDGDNSGAGPEPGEALHAGILDGHSIWYKYVAPATGALLIDTAGSTVNGGSDELDTVLEVYTGASVDALTPVASNDNASDATLTSQAIVPMTGGTTYFIAIDSRNGGGQILLNYSFATGGFIQFSQPDFAVDEDRGPATIKVTRIGGLGTAVSVSYATADASSALAGQDYTAVAGSLNFGPADTEKTFTVPIINDTLLEGDETLSLLLSDPTNGAQFGPISTATLTIDDDEDNPANDFFAAATPIFGDTGNLATSNVGARSEPGEPTHGAPGGASVWFKWRAPASGVATFDTDGSADADGNPLDTLLAVYTGTSVSALTRVAANDNTPISLNARASFGVRGGTTYYIAVDGKNGAQGDLALSWSFGAGGLLQFSQPRYEVNENGPGFATITVRRTDGAVGQVQVDLSATDITATDGADYDGGTTTLTFAAGQTVATLNIPIHDDTLNEGDETVQLTLGNPQQGALVGDLNSAILVINDDEDDPVNDKFANATALSGNSGSIVGLNSGASREPGEPQHAGIAGHRSIWYQWTPSAVGVASFSTAGSTSGGAPLDTLLAVYTGSSVGALTPVATNDDSDPGVKTSRVSFAAKAGTKYFIAVDSAGDNGGEVVLGWSLGAGGLIQFHQQERIVREDAGSIELTVDRVGSSAGAVSVSFTTQEIPGGATANADFTTAAGTLNFADKQTAAWITIPILRDSLVEGNERFAVVLSNPAGGAALSGDTVSSFVTIDDANDDPANDSFATAAVLPGTSGSVNGSLSGAGVEVGEPATAGGRTIWYRWTAPASGRVTFDTAGSGAAGAPLDTILTAFTGSALNSLQPVASNDDASPGDVTSRISFSVLVGTVYQLAVDARLPLSGPAKLHWQLTTGGVFSFDAPAYRVDETQLGVLITVTRSGTNVNAASVAFNTADGTATAPLNYTAKQGVLSFAAGQLSQTLTVPIKNTAVGEQTFTVQLANPSDGATIDRATTQVRIFDTNDDPANDHFSTATVLAGTDDSATSSNVGAGRDAGESLPSPLLQQIGSGRTIWFKWQSPTNGMVTFSTDGSLTADGLAPLDTVMAIFSGSTLSTLKLVAENDEAPGLGKVSAATFKARAGGIYYVVVDTVGDESGSVALTWSTQAPDGDGPLLLPTPGVTPGVTFTENYSDSLKSDGAGGVAPVGTDSITITATASLAEVDPSSFDATTPVSFSVGNFSHTAVLGDATTRTAASATFALTIDGDNGPKKVGSIKYSWTATTLKIAVTASGNTDYSILSTGFTGPVDPAVADVSIAGVTGHRAMYVTGTNKTRTVNGNDLATVALSGTTDYVPPTVAIAPPPAVNADTASIALSGTAKDNFVISDVQVRVNGSDFLDGIVFTLATTSDGSDDPKNATWSIPAVPLLAGVNNVEVVATDESGNVSVTALSLTRPKQSAISIVIVGQGSVNPSFAGTLLDLGKTYVVTATPANGWVFRGWTAGATTQLAPALSFVMADNLVLTAKFIPNPFLGLDGSFSGLVRSGGSLAEQTGVFSVDLTGAGSFSGSFGLGTKRISLKGSFDDAGNALLKLPALKTGSAPLLVSLHLDVAGDSQQITGSIGDGTFASSLVADRVVFDAKSNPAPQAGKYTVLLPPAAGLRSPTGYLTVTVNPDGTLRLIGNLPDNTGPSFGGQLSKNGVLQLYCPITGGGLLLGGAVFNASHDAGAQGTVTWSRPGVPNVDLGFRGEFYTPPVAKTRILPSLVDGKTKSEIGGVGLVPAVVQNFTLGVDNKVTFTTVPNPGVSAIAFTPTTGAFSATIKQGTKSFQARGALLQKSALGAGYFVPAGGTGYVLIGTP